LNALNMANVVARCKAAGTAAFSAIGLDVKIRRDRLMCLRSYGVRTVLDIGANTGQFARQARSLFPRAKVFSFEPIPECLSGLAKTMKGDPEFTAVPFALGAEEGSSTLYCSSFSPSSSLLNMCELHRQCFPRSAETHPLPIRVVRLDSWALEHDLLLPMLVKMDVQGYEDRVIEGGALTISRATLLMIEMSFAELYEGQPLFDDIYERVKSLGFRLILTLGNLYDSHSGRLLQCDAVFANEKT